MGFLAIIFILASLVSFAIGAFIAFVYWMEPIAAYFSGTKDKKKIFPFAEQSWKTSINSPLSEEIRNFRLEVPEETLDDLRRRLENTRFGPQIDGVNFTYGFPPEQLKEVVKYWLKDFDWRKQEKFLNSHDQFTTNIEELAIHFVRSVPSVAENVRIVPILLVHGWPGSFYELLKLIPLLHQPREIAPGQFVAMEVVIPSLPGYGFSEAAQKPGMDVCSMARIFNTLMVRLGHEKYFVHGGDWGSAITKVISIMYPERVLGLSSTMAAIPLPVHMPKSLVARFLPSLMQVDKHEQEHKLFFSFIGKTIREMGYFLIQTTKPNTVGAALSDSPAGLAAYIMEKFSTWTNMANVDSPDGSLRSYFNMDDLLTNVMIYWISNSIMSSQRLYKEFFASNASLNGTRMFPVTVPSVLSDFRHELGGGVPPVSFLKHSYTNLIKVSRHATGGHFPAMECPQDLATDIWMLATSVLQRP